MKLLKRKTWTSVCLMTVLASTSMLAACSSGGSGSAGSATRNPVKEEAKAPVKLSVLTTHLNSEYAKQVKTADDPYIKELSKLSGYDLSFEFLGHAADYDQQLTVRFASRNLADLVRTPNIEYKSHPGAIDEGVFTELGPLLDKYGPNIKKNVPKEAWDSPSVSKNGKIYAIPAIGALPASKVVYIRQDWLDQLGMKQPKTVDEYLAFFEAVKTKDMNGNGNPNDEYGLYVRENLGYADLFFKEFGVSPHAWNISNGELIPDMIRPEMKDAIKFWKMLYDKGYVNPNLFTNKGADWSAGILQGKGGVWVHDIQNYSLGWAPKAFVNQPNAKVDIIDPPTGPKGKGALSLQYDGVYYVWVIPTTSKNAVEAIKFLDWIWSEQADRFFAYGVEGLNYTVENNEVKWNQQVSVNGVATNPSYYQRIINPRGDGLMNPDVLKFSPDAAMLTKGIEVAKNALIKHDGLNMPAPKAFETNPELAPGNGYSVGGLFLDMFAKVVTGKEELDPAFDAFVKEWKRRGGEEAIKQATDWYNKNKGK
ncbi:putative aldouronate transport system substrate-binding protein [Paenibacillus sp. UNCCL117]|uniref:extracellular solute-binding protein n=1 Tax=unclassified Paenibacillus TaxID=185978 RepID=UPI00088C527C|nr:MULTISPECIES: extracellular solute-binding protein [unclassified Paenibacillus]SDC94982.1 putative aldouronate transport system substrate-binding protein [Paenibacillus sp. cl123]SFW29918.1 putative aldouronate transport system substrate-binding protein [Paenibacillus sp. UNCCL117]